MIVFNNYFKIVKKMLPFLIMYFVICIAVSVLVSNVGGGGSKVFETSKSEIVLINEDNSAPANIFEKYVKDTAHIVKLEDNELKTKQDAIFSRKVDAVITVPKGFGDKMKDGEKAKLEIMTVPDSTGATFIEMTYNRFLKVEQTYYDAGLSNAEVRDNIYKDLDVDTDVKIMDKERAKLSNVEYFFNYSNYGIMCILIYGIGMLAIAFNRRELAMRNYASGYSLARINREIYLANIVLAVITWLVFVAAAMIMYGSAMLNINGVIIALNCLVFTMSVLALSFLLASLVKKREAVSGLMNCFALGSSFMCGAFVPRELLGAGALNIGKIFPSYWYIDNNTLIENASYISMDTMKPVLINAAIMIGFGIVFLLLQTLLSKRRLHKGVI